MMETKKKQYSVKALDGFKPVVSYEAQNGLLYRIESKDGKAVKVAIGPAKDALKLVGGRL